MQVQYGTSLVPVCFCRQLLSHCCLTWAAIAAQVKQQWESNCLQKQTGTKEVPYCTCIYTHLEHTGAFKTPASVKLLVRRVNRYMRTGKPSHITRAIMRALSTCQARFPASQSLGGRMTVTPLSSSHH